MWESSESFKKPYESHSSNVIPVLNILEIVKNSGRNIKFYNSGSGEIFGNTNEIVDENHISASIKFRELVTTYSENKDLLMMGGYTQGQDPILDQAIVAWPKITEFIKQKESKKEDFNSSSSQLIQMFGG